MFGCLLVVHPSIKQIFYYDSLVFSKFFEINTKFILHLNILSKLNINYHLFHCIVHIGNINAVDIYLKRMSHIEIWIKDIYELDNFETTWK